MSVLKHTLVSFGDELFKNVPEVRAAVLGEKNKTDERDGEALHALFFIGSCAVGCASACKKESGFEIYKLAVLEQYRKRGHAAALIGLIENEARRLGAEKLTAEFTCELLPVFEKAGLAVCGVNFEKTDGKKYFCAEKDFVFRDAEWLSFGSENEAVIARGDFVLDKKAKTELLVTGLGYCEIYVNGKNISDRVLAPAWTNYCERDLTSMNLPVFDKLTPRILYEKLDITKFVKKGENTVVFHIGGGWFCQHESRNEGNVPYGNIKLCFLMRQGEKTVFKSGKGIKYKKSFVTRSNIYFGEKQDLRLGGFDFTKLDSDISAWKNAACTPAPRALLSLQDCLPDKVIRKIKPKCIFRKGDYAIYDLGENIAGIPVFKFSDEARRDEEAVVRFAENLKADGSLDFHSAGGENRMQREAYIFDGTPDVLLHQHFTWHASRYFDVLGRLEVVEFRVIHTDLKQKIEFKSSNEVIQWIFDSYIRTQQSNTHGCIPSDCPHRERLGYTGDGQLACRAVMTCFDAEKMYLKWMRDVADSQDIYGGHVEHTAPYYGGGGGPGGWGGAIVFVPYNFYKFYGRKEILEKYYPNMLLYLDYMERHSENGLVTSSERAGWCLGDWCSPENRNLIPEPFVNTYFYLKALSQVIEIAGLLGKDSKELATRYKRIKKCFTDKYFDKASGTFCSSLEAADAYGFDLGFGNKKTLEAIVKKYEALGEFDTGIFGTDILIRTLCENGHKDLAFKLLSSKKENTFFNMMNHGATTLWENWNGCDSHSHPMFGAVVEYIVKYFNEIEKQ